MFNVSHHRAAALTFIHCCSSQWGTQIALEALLSHRMIQTSTSAYPWNAAVSWLESGREWVGCSFTNETQNDNNQTERNNTRTQLNPPQTKHKSLGGEAKNRNRKTGKSEGQPSERRCIKNKRLASKVRALKSCMDLPTYWLSQSLWWIWNLGNETSCVFKVSTCNASTKPQTHEGLIPLFYWYICHLCLCYYNNKKKKIRERSYINY